MCWKVCIYGDEDTGTEGAWPFLRGSLFLPLPQPPLVQLPLVLRRVMPVVSVVCGVGCLPLRRGWGQMLRVPDRLPLPLNMPGRGAPLQMSLLPGAVYRVHFVHAQGLQPLLFLIKREGSKAPACGGQGLAASTGEQREAGSVQAPLPRDPGRPCSEGTWAQGMDCGRAPLEAWVQDDQGPQRARCAWVFWSRGEREVLRGWDSESGLSP